VVFAAADLGEQLTLWLVLTMACGVFLGLLAWTVFCYAVRFVKWLFWPGIVSMYRAARRD
jgi:hypothetical protein